MASSSSSPSPVTVSAPGKVLLVGGYLVLERPNVGCVVAANSRFYTTVQASTKPHIHVTSPQFHCEWCFEYNDQGNLSASPHNCNINPFVEKTLRVCLLYLVPPKTSQVSLEIVIQADNEFYSVLPHLLQHNQPRTLEAAAALPRFLPCPMDPNNPGSAMVNKTGLGSSAALTTSLVGALVYYFSKDPNVTMIHNLAQICHCHAQGKVGSGFDVSAACYGTHVYRRFPKTLLPDLLGQLEHEEATNSHLLNARDTIENLAEDEWEDDMVEPLSLSLGTASGGGIQLQILLADVQGGTESPGMAKTVLNWKQSQRPPIPHWDELKVLNAKVVSLMHSLSSPADEGANVDYDALALLPFSQWPSDLPLTQLAKTFVEIRTHLRLMGEEAKAPIEPPPQTKLCDATSQLPGVVTCLVPGAGGYDAVACLYIDRPTVREAITNLWSTWESPIICPLNVHASSEGLRLETSSPTTTTTAGS